MVARRAAAGETPHTGSLLSSSIGCRVYNLSPNTPQALGWKRQHYQGTDFAYREPEAWIQG